MARGLHRGGDLLILDDWGLTPIQDEQRRDLLEIASNPEFSGSHEFKVAAMRKTIAFPVDPWFQLGDPRLILALLLAVLPAASVSAQSIPM